VENLIYSPEGLGWNDGVLNDRFSTKRPRVVDCFYWTAPVPDATIKFGTVLQSQFPNTYGDWLAQCLIPLIKNVPLRSPLLLPTFLFRKPYVKRDLARLGIHACEIDRPTLVENATILPQVRPLASFLPADIDSYRTAFNVSASLPSPGSILYLSRSGERSTWKREYPSETVAAIVNKLGGRVIHAKDASLECYISAAKDAETVIADHGSAMCNIAYWRTRNVIELFSNSWWNKYFICFGWACGVDSYQFINIDSINSTVLESRIRNAIANTSFQKSNFVNG
jgi:capsular polysaccharide biosynthesis protein